MGTERRQCEGSREKAIQRQRTGVMCLKAKGCQQLLKSHQKEQEKSSLQVQREHDLANTLIWTSSLLNCGTINFYCSRSPSWWHIVSAAVGNWYWHLTPPGIIMANLATFLWFCCLHTLSFRARLLNLWLKSICQYFSALCIFIAIPKDMFLRINNHMVATRHTQEKQQNIHFYGSFWCSSYIPQSQ